MKDQAQLARDREGGRKVYTEVHRGSGEYIDTVSFGPDHSSAVHITFGKYDQDPPRVMVYMDVEGNISVDVMKGPVPLLRWKSEQYKPQPVQEAFQVGDRVRDFAGKEGTVRGIDPSSVFPVLVLSDPGVIGGQTQMWRSAEGLEKIEPMPDQKMLTTEFKVGDRVKTTLTGREAIIIEINPANTWPIKVQFDGRTVTWHSENGLEKISD